MVVEQGWGAVSQSIRERGGEPAALAHELWQRVLPPFRRMLTRALPFADDPDAAEDFTTALWTATAPPDSLLAMLELGLSAMYDHELAVFVMPDLAACFDQAIGVDSHGSAAAAMLATRRAWMTFLIAGALMRARRPEAANADAEAMTLLLESAFDAPQSAVRVPVLPVPDPCMDWCEGIDDADTHIMWAAYRSLRGVGLQGITYEVVARMSELSTTELVTRYPSIADLVAGVATKVSPAAFEARDTLAELAENRHGEDRVIPIVVASLLHPDQRQLREYEVSLAHGAHIDPRVRKAVEKTEASHLNGAATDVGLDHYQRSLDVGMLWVANVLPEVWQLPYSTLAWRMP
jgi:hypothetical protein